MLTYAKVYGQLDENFRFVPDEGAGFVIQNLSQQESIYQTAEDTRFRQAALNAGIPLRLRRTLKIQRDSSNRITKITYDDNRSDTTGTPFIGGAQHTIMNRTTELSFSYDSKGCFPSRSRIYDNVGEARRPFIRHNFDMDLCLEGARMSERLNRMGSDIPESLCQEVIRIHTADKDLHWWVPSAELPISVSNHKRLCSGSDPERTPEDRARTLRRMASICKDVQSFVSDRLEPGSNNNRERQGTSVSPQ